MPLLHIDTQIDLFYPNFSPSGRDFVYATYLSQLDINGSVFPVSIALPVKEEGAQLLPSGTVAHVTGSLSVSGNSLLVTASEIMPLYVASTPQTRAGIAKLYKPFLTAVGFVSSGRVHDLDNPAALVVDVTVERTDRWPHSPVTLRGTPLILSGVLLGWEDGKLALDVHDVRCNNNGEAPDHPLVAYPNPFQFRPVIDGYVVFDGSSPPPPYRANEKDMSSPGVEEKTGGTPTEVSESEAACSGPASSGRKLVAKRAIADLVVSPSPRPDKVARTSNLRESAV
ncbi:hypothetical protein AURDEDRAFT_130406 [Auricularia subglabra TFB-10046 SS5]|uniref:Uncharacterized protein n=1 Tax=Auricularia subglabra (strain TFB-10046 / SS5) TaxID=717982 RepID=J0LF69_AURST|nr:hypothetical protein AURDEDRAFT_130406 [Auricularia subglabra TFB-10046 SS5]